MPMGPFTPKWFVVCILFDSSHFAPLSFVWQFAPVAFYYCGLVLPPCLQAMSVLHYLRASVAFTPTSLLQCLTREAGKIKDRSVKLEDYIVFLSLAQWSEVAYVTCLSDGGRPQLHRKCRSHQRPTNLPVCCFYSRYEHHDQGFSKGKKKSQKFGRKPVYTQVYTHSKLMIVDDWCLIVGSANINDRSMLGDRDSEMAVYIEDRELVSVQMGSKEVAVGKNIHKFRMQLLNKCLALEKDDETTSNLVCDDIYRDLVLNTAKKNTEAFHAVFPEFPHSSYRSMKQYDQVRTCRWCSTLQFSCLVCVDGLRRFRAGQWYRLSPPITVCDFGCNLWSRRLKSTRRSFGRWIQQYAPLVTRKMLKCWKPMFEGSSVNFRSSFWSLIPPSYRPRTSKRKLPMRCQVDVSSLERWDRWLPRAFTRIRWRAAASGVAIAVGSPCNAAFILKVCNLFCLTKFIEPLHCSVILMQVRPRARLCRVCNSAMHAEALSGPNCCSAPGMRPVKPSMARSNLA